MNIACSGKQLSLMLAMLFALCVCTAQEIKRPPLTGIAFVELQVGDVKKATVFYESVMGYHMEPVVSSGSKNHSFSIQVNHRQSIQLQDGLPAGQDERLLCLAFQTTDAEAFRLYLQAKGWAVPAGVTKEKGGNLSFMVKDADNHPVKFLEYAANNKAQTISAAKNGFISARILHAGLTIKNAQAANAFYAGLLGFSEIWRGGANDSVTSWINMRVPEGTDYLEYMLVNDPVSRQQLGSLHHIALMVPDMQQAVDILNIRSKATGYIVAPPRIGRNNRWQLNLFDPDGTRLELMEPFTMR